MPKLARSVFILAALGFFGGCTTPGGVAQSPSCVATGDAAEPEVELLRAGCQYMSDVVREYDLQKKSKTVSGEFKNKGKPYTISCVVIQGRVDGEVVIYGRSDWSRHSANFVKGSASGVFLAEYPSGFRVLGSFARGAQSGTWVRIGRDGAVTERVEIASSRN